MGALSYEVLGQNVRRAREAAGLTIEEVAEKLEFSTKYVTLVEAGQRTVSLKKFMGFCLVLNVTPSDLLENTYIPPDT